MDLDSFAVFARTRRGQDSSLSLLSDRYIGRKLLDQQGRVIGAVQDVLITSREKFPRYLVVCSQRWHWALRSEVFIYPIHYLVKSEGEGHQSGGLHLVAMHSAASVRRLLDFRPDFLRTAEDPDCLSLAEYLAVR